MVGVRHPDNDDNVDTDIADELGGGIDEAHNVVFNNLIRYMLFKKHHEDCEGGPGGRQLGANAAATTSSSASAAAAAAALATTGTTAQ